jgi:hypothetical protein
VCGAHGPTNNQVSFGGAGKIVVALDVIARAGASVIRSLSDQLKMMADGCEAKCGLHIERKKEREHDINAHPGRKN